MRRLSSHNAALIALLSVVAFSSLAQPKYANPAGKKFPIVAWYQMHHEEDASKERYQKLADGGFTLVLSRFEKDSNINNALNAIQGTGLKFILANSMITGIPNDIKDFIGRYKNKDNIALWDTWDEPLPRIFPTLKEKIAAMLSVNGNHKMHHLNLFPSYVSRDSLGCSYEEYLNRAIKELSLPFVSYDHYPVHDTLDRPTNTWKTVFKEDFYYNFAEVRKICNNNDSIPFWAFCMSSAHQKPGGDTRYTAPSLGLLKLEAHAALAYGAQGLQYYRIAAVDRDNLKFSNVPIDSAGNTNFVWNRIVTVNQKIQKHASIFLGNKVKHIWHFGPDKMNKLPDIGYIPVLPSPFTSIEGNLDDGVLVSHFTNGNRHFMMIVNKNYKQAQTVSVKRESNVRLVNSDGIFIRDNHVDFSVPAGDYILFTWV